MAQPPHFSWMEKAERLAERYPCYALLLYLFVVAEIICIIQMLAGG